MGMLSRAMKKRKKEMEEELEQEILAPGAIIRGVTFPDELARSLAEMSQMRGISVEQLVITRMTAMTNAYHNQKILRLQDQMPYGQYRGILVEDMIRTDPRYVNWLASSSEIFVLDEAATELLKEIS